MAVHQNPKGFFWWQVRVVLRILSFFYYIGIKLRLYLYWVGILRSRKLAARVISVGNLTVGGTGKTPFVLYLAEKLVHPVRSEQELVNKSSQNTNSQNGNASNVASRKVGILTRGYGSNTKATEDDENMALPDNVIRAINPDRFSAGQKLIKEQGVQTIILDDGFQHLCLRRDVDIVLIDATNPFGKGRLMPAGILREPLAALKRADIFVITHADLVTSEQLSALEQKLKKYNKKIVHAIHKPQYLVSISPSPQPSPLEGEGRERGNLYSVAEIPLSEIKGKNIWEFCGIGNPFQFHKTLNALCNIKGLSVFPDHYYYSQPDLQTMFLKARMEKAEAFVTTEKDALRLKGVKIPGDIPCYYLKIKIEVTQGKDIIDGLVKNV